MSPPSFDPSEPGTPAAAWRPLLDGLPALEPPGPGDRVLVLAAHPDDETLGAGGLIAGATAAGARVTVVVATDGEASHPHSPTHTPAHLAERRRREVRDAVARLAGRAGAAELAWLRLPDGRLAQLEPELAELVRELLAGATHVVSPWSGDGHPDHEACGRVAAALAEDVGARHWQFPIWAWHWDDPRHAALPLDRLRRLPLTDEAVAAKQAAMGCHVSQYQPLSAAAGDEPILPPRVLQHFRRDAEVFVIPAEPVPPRYFTDLYAAAEDPWGLADRFYEQRKRALLVGSLTRARFRRAFEPGCATGLISAELAQRCDEVVAWDVAPAAVARTQARVAGHRQVHVEQRGVPDDWPGGRFDLVVLSEVGYYCADLARLADRVAGCLTDDGALVACHWRHPAPMHPHTAEQVHAALGAGRRLVVDHVEDDFLLQVWSRDGRSVAAAEGIVP